MKQAPGGMSYLKEVKTWKWCFIFWCLIVSCCTISVLYFDVWLFQAVQSVFYILMFDCFRLYDQCFIFWCLIVSGCTISVLYSAVWLFQAVQSVLDSGMQDSLQELYTKVLKKSANQPEPPADQVDDTILI